MNFNQAIFQLICHIISVTSFFEHLRRQPIHVGAKRDRGTINGIIARCLPRQIRSALATETCTNCDGSGNYKICKGTG